MKKIFLADADAPEREAIRAVLAAQPEKYQVIGEATDGETALPLIRDLQPDILIVDLRLSFVDGLTLCRLARRELPWVRAVLLSGFDDPGYAREAKAMEAEYLLKPVNPYELPEAVERASERIDLTMPAILQRMRRAHQHTPQRQLQRERALSDWLCDGGEQDLPPMDSTVRCRLLTVTGISGKHIWLTCGVLRLLERNGAGNMDMYVLDPPRGPALAVTGGDARELQDFSYRTARTIQRTMEHLTGAPARVQISDEAAGLADLRRVWLETPKLEARQSDARPVYGAGDALRRNPGRHGPVNALADRMLCAGEAEIIALVNRCWRMGGAWSELAAQGAAQFVCELREEQTGALSDQERAQIFAGWPPQRERAAQTDQLLRALRLRDAMAPNLPGTPLGRARYYLSTNFSNPGVPMHAAAREAGMSVSRFGVVFAQEMGLTFSEYLIEMRLSVARLLLTATRMRPSAVAQRVGYDDLSHFDNLFRRCVGVDMREYRRLHGEK